MVNELTSTFFFFRLTMTAVGTSRKPEYCSHPHINCCSPSVILSWWKQAKAVMTSHTSIFLPNTPHIAQVAILLCSDSVQHHDWGSPKYCQTWAPSLFTYSTVQLNTLSCWGVGEQNHFPASDMQERCPSDTDAQSWWSASTICHGWCQSTRTDRSAA